MNVRSKHEVALRDAPARFFADDWAELVKFAGSAAGAQEILAQPEPGIIGFYRQQNLERGYFPSAERAEQENLVAAQTLAEALREAVKEDLIAGCLNGEGIFSGTGQHQSIPTIIWPDLTLNFETGEASGKIGCYSYLVISEPAARVDRKSQIVDWLKKRLLGIGPELKKELDYAARAEFGEAHQVRAFNDAYSEVYQHERGRPKQSRKIK